MVWFVGPSSILTVELEPLGTPFFAGLGHWSAVAGDGGLAVGLTLPAHGFVAVGRTELPKYRLEACLIPKHTASIS